MREGASKRYIHSPIFRSSECCPIWVVRGGFAGITKTLKWDHPGLSRWVLKPMTKQHEELCGTEEEEKATSRCSWDWNGKHRQAMSRKELNEVRRWLSPGPLEVLWHSQQPAELTERYLCLWSPVWQPQGPNTGPSMTSSRAYILSRLCPLDFGSPPCLSSYAPSLWNQHFSQKDLILLCAEFRHSALEIFREMCYTEKVFLFAGKF